QDPVLGRIQTLTITVGPLGVSDGAAGSTVTKSCAIGAVYDSTGTTNWATMAPSLAAVNWPQGTLLSATFAHRRETPPGGSTGIPFSTTAPRLASRSRATRPTAPPAVPTPAIANERITLGSCSVAVTSCCSASSCRVR